MSTAPAAKPTPTLTFETAKTEFYPEWGFRPHTLMLPMRMNFIFLNGGMGDYVTWLRPIQWLAERATWIHGNLIIPTYFKEFAAHFLKPYPSWTYHEYSELTQIPKVDQMPFRGPVELQRESLNATGAHLSTCGWVYFTNKEKAPPGYEHYPHFEQADLDAIALPPGLKLPKRYAVFTAGMTTNSRKAPAGAWNPIIKHVLELGIEPVFLGKAVMDTGNAKNIHTTYDPGLRADLGLDLRDKTSLLQAAAIMSRAEFVIGHDNGLLHIAGCTDVPIIFGYNIASPEHREPARKVGRVYNVCLTDAELACNFCQSKTNFVIGFNFRECFYGDLKCQTMLFENGGARWKSAINQCLEDSDATKRPALND